MRKAHLRVLGSIAALVVGALCSVALANEASTLSSDQVGPGAMPPEIAPITAPFEMGDLAKPHFGDRRVALELNSAKQRTTLVTRDIQVAIDQLSAAGGGTLVLPEGEWLTGRVELKSGVNLHVPRGTTLNFSGQVEDYLPVVQTRYEGTEVMSVGALIYARDAHRIAVTGGGKLVGPKSGPLREARKGLIDDLLDTSVPVEQRVMDGRNGRHYLRPQFVCLLDCREVLIEGVTLRNSPMWNIVPIYCEQVIVRGVTIESQEVVNGDGVNIVSCRNVLVEYCSTNTGDDCYALKAGRGEDGLRTSKPVENVVLRFNHSTGGTGGIAFGSETAGGIRDIYAHDCVFEGVRHAVYIKTRRPRGGGGERINIERVRFTATYHGVLIDMIGLPMYVGELGNRLPRREHTRLTPFYRDLTIRDLEGTCATGNALKIKGIPESPASDLLFERLSITGPGLPNLADVADCEFVDCTFRAEQPALKFLDAVRVMYENCRLVVADGLPEIEVSGPQSKDIAFSNVTPPLSGDNVRLHDGAEPSSVQIQQ
ncbi:glycoside hydrolase family 28 protein [Aeoliella sp.]|uniref:glycoside hydrolase family 28 protein n=1 Tax=Aeoliella sp. TaxID=2795800 RepID=UPI003CCBE37C